MERLIVMRMVRAIITNDHVGLKTQSESEGRSPPTSLSAFFFEENVHHVIEAGAIDTVVAAMHAHPDDTVVQYFASWALGLVATNGQQSSVSVAKAGAIEAIVASMHSHRTHGDTQYYGCWALWSLGSQSPELLRRIKTAGGRETVQAALKHFSARQDLREVAVELLKMLDVCQ